jgi:4,5-DOPA dioxygenase extradiol
MTLPSLFLSHGSPMLAIEDVTFTREWVELGKKMARPRSILVISAHWDTDGPMVSGAAKPDTIHDFFGFPPELEHIRYAAPGDPALAQRVSQLLGTAGLTCPIDARRGLDHGAWVPLKWMYPAADIPVVQLSVQSRLGPAHHQAMGRALAPLRGEGVLVLGSGGIVHNLRELDWHRTTPGPLPWAGAFNDWMADRLAAGAEADLIDYRRRAPEASRNQPTEEHFVPLFVALWAGGFPARRIELGFDLGSLGMDGYFFG